MPDSRAVRSCFIHNRCKRPGVIRSGLLILTAVTMLLQPARAQRIEPAQTMLINPRALAIDSATHRMYAVDQLAGSVTAVDEVTGAATSIPVGKAPDALAIDPLASRIYVSNSGSNTITVIDGVSEAVIATVPAGRIPYAIQVDPNLHKAYVTNTYSPIVTVVDGLTNTTSTLPLGAKDAIAIDTKRHRMFLLGYEDPGLQVVDLVKGDRSREPAVMHLWGLAVDERRGILYATESQSEALLAIQEESGKQTTITTGAMPCAASVDTRTGDVYVANYETNSVTVVDGAAGRAVASIAVGIHPEAIAVDEARSLIYVANTHSNNVSVIDGVTMKVIATLAAGRNPYAIAIDSVRGDVYVANFGTPSYTRLENAMLHR